MKSNKDQIKAMDGHEWMAKYYGQLKGGVIQNVSIAVMDEEPNLAFPRLTIKLFNGKVVETEVVSIHDEGIPGVIYGLPWDEKTFKNNPTESNYFHKENN